MKKRMDKNIIEYFASLKIMLSETNFRKNLKMQLKEYEINEEFIRKFKDYLDVSVCENDLTPGCIKLLNEYGLFDYDIWKNNIKFKNVDILLDNDFVIEHHIDKDEILSQINFVSDNIFNRFVNDCSIDSKINLITKYRGNLSYETVFQSFDILQDKFFDLPIVKEKIKNDKTEITHILKQTLTPLAYVTLVNEYYIPKELLEYNENIDMSFESTSTNDNRIGILLYNILQKYPDEVVNSMIPLLLNHCPVSTFANTNVLRLLLIQNDNIGESNMMLLSPYFASCGLRKEMVQYCLNHDYKAALVKIKFEGIGKEEE